jgi:hypothetical protein
MYTTAHHNKTYRKTKIRKYKKHVTEENKKEHHINIT